MNKLKILSLIATVAIGLIIAVLLKPDNTQPSAVDNKASLLESLNSEPEVIIEEKELSTIETIKPIESRETTLSNDLESHTEKTLNSNLILTADSEMPEPVETLITEKLIYMITLKTSMGDIELALDAEKAPITVENFVNYAKNGQYDGTIFHRVIKGFMVQGGGFEPGMQQKKVGGPIPNEANNGLSNKKYSIAMARTSDPHSATAQFFINATDNDFLNFTSESGSGWGYAVFGEVTKGHDIVDAIEGVSTGNTGGFGDVPLEDVVIESVIVAD